MHALGEGGGVAPVDEDVDVGVELAFFIEQVLADFGVAGDDDIYELFDGDAFCDGKINGFATYDGAEGGVEIDIHACTSVKAFLVKTVVSIVYIPGATVKQPRRRLCVTKQQRHQVLGELGGQITQMHKPIFYVNES